MDGMVEQVDIADAFALRASAVIYPGDCQRFLGSVPDDCVQLVVTSPPYNIGKPYEKRMDLDAYVAVLPADRLDGARQAVQARVLSQQRWRRDIR